MSSHLTWTSHNVHTHTHTNKYSIAFNKFTLFFVNYASINLNAIQNTWQKSVSTQNEDFIIICFLLCKKIKFCLSKWNFNKKNYLKCMRNLRKEEARYVQVDSSLYQAGKSQDSVACLCAQCWKTPAG